MLTIPDLLHLEPELSVDQRQVSELLEMAFLGRDTGGDLDEALGGTGNRDARWRPEFFAEDLFLDELLRSSYPVTVGGKRYRPNIPFLARTLEAPPRDMESVLFRQAIVRELEESAEIRGRFEALYDCLYELLNKLRLPGQVARLDINTYRLEVLRHAKLVIDEMVDGFGGAESGIRRLHETGLKIQESAEYRLLAALVEYEEKMSTIRVDVNVGATGQITDLAIAEIIENEENLFHLGPLERLKQRLSFLIRGYKWDSTSVVSRLVHQVFLRLTPSLTPLVQLIGHLELYLANRGFRRVAEEAGLEVSLAELADDGQVEFVGLFNALLLNQPAPVVPCDVAPRGRVSTTLVTGPNSGGKTRLMQAIGLAQLMGQSGLYVAAREARLSLVGGLFISLIQRETADQSEGRLGRELMRIRTMFDAIEPPSLVILDELCSGTNPSEGTELFSLVLRLLERIGPLAFITTHFLDYARELESGPPVTGLEFLQVEIDANQNSTYQFVPGVAETSLAAVMAERLGVTYEELSSALDRRLGRERRAS
jgi:DNA mismatch repair protein MutS2